MNADHHDDSANKKTLLGVGLSTLLAAPALPHVREHEPEPTVLVSAELDAAARPIAKGKTTEKIARAAVLPTLPTRRWRIGAIAAVALAASVAIGLCARWWIASDIAAPRSTKKPAIVLETKKPAAAQSAAPATAAPIAIASKGATGPRVVDFGDGSCSAVIDAKAGGDVTLDDQPIGATPVTVEGLWCGRTLTVRIHRSGFDTWTKTIVTQEGRTSRIVAALRRPPASPRAAAETPPARVETAAAGTIEPSPLDKIRRAVFPRS
jgi:hypothetical protein